MDNLCTGAEFVDGIGYTVVKARAHGQDHIAVMHRHVGLIEPVHTQHAQELTVRSGVASQTHQCVGHRIIQAPRQPRQDFRTFTLDNAAPGINHRTFGREQQPCRLANLAAVTALSGLIRTQTHRFGVVILEFVFGVGQIFGNVHNHRTRSTASGNVKRLFNNGRDLFGASYHEAVLHNGTRYPHHVGLLKRVFTNKVTLYLPRQHHHGNRIHVSGGNTGNRIGRARARGDQHHARLAGSTGIAIGRMGRRLLVSN